MRIALVSQEYPPETAKGGIGSQTHTKAHGLAALGHEVHVISRSPDGARSLAADGRVQVLRIPGREHRIGLYSEIADWVTYSGEVAEAIAGLHSRAPLDLVDFPEWAAEGFVHLVNASEWNPLPAVVQLHGPLVMFAHAMGWPGLNSEFYRTGTHLEGTCLRLATAVFSSSACSRDWCVRHYGLRAESIPILHAGVDTEAFAPRPRPKSSRPTIVYAGRLASNKGVDTLVEAACGLARHLPDLQLRLIGRGSEGTIDRLRQMAGRAGFPRLLDLPGFVPHAELPIHFSEAHAFAAPSDYEGGPGFVTIEAMACGLPVVVCSGSGGHEAVIDGQTGFVVPPRDPEALAEALGRIMTSPALAHAMGQRARAHAVSTCDSRSCVARIEAFYREVVQRCASERPSGARP